MKMKTVILAYLKKTAVCCCTLLSSVLICSCYSQEQIDSANKIITALSTEIEGCTFIKDIDSNAAARIENARFELKMKAESIGGTHIVETHAYPTRLIGRSVGVVLSARVYKCPLGKGPLVASEGSLTKTPDINIDYMLDDDDIEIFYLTGKRGLR